MGPCPFLVLDGVAGALVTAVDLVLASGLPYQTANGGTAVDGRNLGSSHEQFPVPQEHEARTTQFFTEYH